MHAVAKQIQWSWPDTHGEDHFVVMFGGLHVEMTALKTIGDLLEESGWTGALVQAGVATSGTADSFLKASHVTRTRRAHQVTASSLYLLLQKAYADYSNDLDEGDDLVSLEDWCTERAASCPQFHFWWMILQPGTTGDDICASNKRRKFPALCSDKARTMVLCLGTHPLCQMDTCPLT